MFLNSNTDKPTINTLPSETLISILRLTTLPTLHNFGKASSATHAFVNGCICEIFDFVLKATSGAIPGDTLLDFIPYTSRLGKHSPTSGNPSIQVLRAILALSSVIDSVITPYCPKSLIQQCMTMQPRELVDKSFCYATYGASWRQQPDGRLYQPLNSGPPSEVEFYRVCRALWRIQMHSDLQRARSQLSWPTSDITNLATMNTIEYYTTGGGSSEKLTWHELEEVTTVYNWLVGQQVKEQYAVHQSSNVNHINNAILPSLNQFPFRSLPSPEDMTNYWSDMPEADLKIPTNTIVNWKDSVRYLRRAATGQAFINMHLSRHWTSPIRDVPPHFFRRYGVALWDLKRLFALGLWTLQLAMAGPIFAQGLLGEMVFRWRSLLSDEELENVESRLEAGVGLRGM